MYAHIKLGLNLLLFKISTIEIGLQTFLDSFEFLTLSVTIMQISNTFLGGGRGLLKLDSAQRPSAPSSSANLPLAVVFNEQIDDGAGGGGFLGLCRVDVFIVILSIPVNYFGEKIYILILLHRL